MVLAESSGVDVEGLCNYVTFVASYARQAPCTEIGRRLREHSDRLFMLGRAASEHSRYRELREAARARGLGERDACVFAGMIYESEHPSKSRIRIVH